VLVLVLVLVFVLVEVLVLVFVVVLVEVQASQFSVPAVQVPVACAKIFGLAIPILNKISAIFNCFICMVCDFLNRKLVRTSIYDFGSEISYIAHDTEIVVTQVPKLGDRTFYKFFING
jgi:hypothetical protein